MSYGSTVSGDNPKHFWRLADSGGQTRFDIGSTPFHMISSNGSAQYTGPSSDGGSELVDNNNGPVTRTAQTSYVHGSFECWCYIWQAPSSVPGYFCAWDAVTTGDWLELTLDGSLIPKAANGATVISGPALSLQAWHHLVATADGTTLRLWVDNVNVASAASGALTVVTRQFGAGLKPNATNSVFAHLAEVAVYDYALIGAQIANHYAAADIRTQPPIFKTGVGLSTAAGSQLGSLNDILNAVRKVITT